MTTNRIDHLIHRCDLAKLLERAAEGEQIVIGLRCPGESQSIGLSVTVARPDAERLLEERRLIDRQGER